MMQLAGDLRVLQPKTVIRELGLLRAFLGFICCQQALHGGLSTRQ